MFECLKETGVKAVTYMPTRNTPAQLKRLRGLCEQYGMFQISGEGHQLPPPELCDPGHGGTPQFQNLIDATWQLIEHETV